MYKRTSNERSAFMMHEEMKSLFKSASGVSVDEFLPNSDDPLTKALVFRHERITKDMASYLDKNKTKFSAKIRRLAGRSADCKGAKMLVREISETLGMLQNTTNTRTEHKFLSMLALNKDLSAVEGLRNALFVSDCWTIDFNHASEICENRVNHACPVVVTTTAVITIPTFLMKLGLTDKALIDWWRKKHIEVEVNEARNLSNALATPVWSDMKYMARRMVFVLDAIKTEKDTTVDRELYAECISSAQTVATELPKFLDEYPSRYEEMRPCAELFFCLIFILDLSLTDLKTRAIELVAEIGPVLKGLRQFVTMFRKLPGALRVEELDGNQRSGCGNECLDPEHGSFPNFSLNDLKRLKLRRVVLEDHLGVSIGCGSTAVVKTHRTQDDTRQCAVKYYKVEKCNCAKRHWNRIIREAEFWVKARHQHINKLIGYCTTEDSAYPGLVMELCVGNLNDFICMKSLGRMDRLTLVCDAASGLDFLHEENHAHGDLRSENILIKEDGILGRYIGVLSDFGFADASAFNRISLPTTGQKIPEAYRAPEFYKRDSNKQTTMVTKEADIYAFGCVFVEVIYQSTLYQDATMPIHRLKEIGTPPVLPHTLDDKDYGKFLGEVWRSKPKERPKSSQVLNTLGGFLTKSRLSNDETRLSILNRSS